MNVREFERELAEMMHGVRESHDNRNTLEGADERDDAVTNWRAMEHVADAYTGGEVPRGAFWAGLPTVDRFAELLRRYSRFNRCRPDGTAGLNRDSVAVWEFETCYELIAHRLYSRHALDGGRERDAQRLTLETLARVRILAAYSGLKVGDLLAMADVEDTPHMIAGGGESPSKLRDAVRMGRPTR